jgi:hypothetical protein
MSVTRRRYQEGGNTIRSRKATAENDKDAFCAKIVIFAQTGRAGRQGMSEVFGVVMSDFSLSKR